MSEFLAFGTLGLGLLLGAAYLAIVIWLAKKQPKLVRTLRRDAPHWTRHL